MMYHCYLHSWSSHDSSCPKCEPDEVVREINEMRTAYTGCMRHMWDNESACPLCAKEDESISNDTNKITISDDIKAVKASDGVRRCRHGWSAAAITTCPYCELKLAHYKGRGNHSVTTLEQIVEAQREELIELKACLQRIRRFRD